MRNSTIDFARLIAAFFVITLHVGYYQDVSYIFGEVARLSGRWAVPFFFVVSGYFIGSQEKENECHLQAFRVIKIFIISSVMYLPYCLLKDPIYLESISIKGFVKYGTYFHLWFLSSFAIGLLSFQVLHKTYQSSLLIVSIGLILAYLITDIASYLETENFFRNFHGTIRHSMSLAFIIVGYKIARYEIERLPHTRLLLMTIFCIFLAYFIEPFVVEWLIGSDTMKRQFPAFTALVTISIMLICLKISIKDSIFSEAGKKYSLGIYLVHPLFLHIFNKTFSNFPLPKTIPVLVLTFLSSWLFISVLNKRVPFLYSLLYGNFRLKR
ncbi:acyltransferase [Colwellia sp. MEBiC06753]